MGEIGIKTYQDLVKVGQNEVDRMAFIRGVISEHKASALYRTAADAALYYRHQNPTIMRAQKYVYDIMGRRVPDIYSANNKIPSRFYFYFVTQTVQFLLGNGVSFSDETTKAKLGENFDNAIQKALTLAMNGGVSYGFWNVDHLEIFGVADGESDPAFAALYDEENGALRAGVRYWQVEASKPLRATLYEEDGFTEYIQRSGEDMTTLQEKRAYVQLVAQSAASGTEIIGGQNYPGFPIIPLFNVNRQSELVGGRETLDAYDLMASALINNVDDANLIYWIIKNAGGMDDEDDMKFVQRLKTTHVAHVDDNAEVEDHSVNVAYEANDAALALLRKQLFDDFMALDVKEIAGGAVTATQIKAAYEPLNSKADMLEYQVTDFILRLLKLIGIDDKPTYTRSMLINQSEAIQTLVMAATYLPEDYITRKALEIFGDIDDAEAILEQMDIDAATRLGIGAGQAPEPGQTGE